jgi:D-proline reductase (dithiol) PrdB
MATPLRQATIALVGTAGIALAGDQPFDQEGERKNPWWGDPSYRVIPSTATARDVRLHHMHIDRSFGERDLDCVLPIARLRELEAAGEIGRAAPSHYSIMGYQLDTDELLGRTVPQMIARMRAEEVDAVLLVPV